MISRNGLKPSFLTRDKKVPFFYKLLFIINIILFCILILISQNYGDSTRLIQYVNKRFLYNNRIKHKDVKSVRKTVNIFIKDKDVSSRFYELQIKWKHMLVSDNYDKTNTALVQYAERLSTEAKDLYQTLNRNLDRTHLWPIEVGNTVSADYTTQFTKLLKLTFAYGTNGTSFYKDRDVYDAIVSGLRFMYEKGYDGKQYRGNWWDWQIGVPQAFLGIIMVLYDELTVLERQMYTKAISGFVPSPYKQLNTVSQSELSNLTMNSFSEVIATGANRANLALIVLGLGILQHDSGKIKQASHSILDLFKPVTIGDGFYKDGSFIQHNYVPYTGSYGYELMEPVCQILAITKDTPYEMDQGVIRLLVETVEKAFIPLIYNGKMLSIVNGRSISRAPLNGKLGYGTIFLYTLLLVSNIAPTESRNKLKEYVKYWMKKNPTYCLNNTGDNKELLMTLSLLNDSSIAGDHMPFVGTKMYASMDRFVQLTPNYTAALALYSSRISAFEAGNKENKRGWHTSDGMLYLYNDDEVQFDEPYWPTVDPYRLPGTTVDTTPLKDEDTVFKLFRAKEKWVGGVSNHGQAVVGMSLNKAGTKNNGQLLPMNLRGKKSWFFVDDLIVALGAGIHGDTSDTIETVVDNRLLNHNYIYQVLSNNGEITAANEQSKKEWLLLQCDHEHASIGYYFPEKVIVEVVTEQRSGTYNEINKLFTSFKKYREKYIKFLINHGSHPRNESYAYVILPGISVTGAKTFGERKPISILRNTIDVQAIEMRDYNYLAVNIWKGAGGEVAGIRVDGPVSLLRQTNGERVSYTLSDPTQSQRLITLSVPEFKKLVNKSDGVTYNRVNNKFQFNFTNAAGASKTIVVS